VVSARTGTVLGALEILVFVVLAVWLIVKAGSANTGSVFTLHYATLKGYKGFSGVVAGSIYTILAFIGFEAAAPLAEEARNPRRTIGIAVVTSCLVIGLFYVLGTYAGDVFFGPGQFEALGALNGGSPWIQLARDVWGIGWVIAFLAILNSTFANGNAGTMATTRTWYAMARVGVLPRPLAATHPKYRSPYVGVIVQFVLTLAVGIPLGVHFGPVTTFALLATILTGIMVAIYIVFNLSCIMFYARHQRSEFNWFLHLVVPVVGIIAFLPAWFTALGIGKAVLKFVSPLSYPISETGLIIGVWYLIGLGVLIYLYARHPSRLPEMRQVFADEPVIEAAGSTGGREGA
jgi:amino acid transporter